MLNWFRRQKNWFLSLYRANSTNYNKFIIIGKSRSGTTFLQTLLSSHNQIISHDEVFHLFLRRRNNDIYAIINDPIGYINGKIYRSYRENVKAVGYKMVYRQIGSDNVFLRKMETKDITAKTKETREKFFLFIQANFDLTKARQRFADYLTNLVNDHSIKVIHVKRRNKLETFLSWKLACRSGVWDSNQGSYLSGPTHLDFKECLRFFEETDALEKKYASLFQDHEIIQVFYEDMIKDTNNSLRKIQSFLGVEYEPPNSPLKKQNKLRTPEAISNYLELKEKFKDTKWC